MSSQVHRNRIYNASFDQYWDQASKGILINMGMRNAVLDNDTNIRKHRNIKSPWLRTQEGGGKLYWFDTKPCIWKKSYLSFYLPLDSTYIMHKLALKLEKLMELLGCF